MPVDEHGRKPKKVREERIALDAFRAGPPSRMRGPSTCLTSSFGSLSWTRWNALGRAALWTCPTPGQPDRFAHLKPGTLPRRVQRQVGQAIPASPGTTSGWAHAQLIGRSRKNSFGTTCAKYGLPLAIGWPARCGTSARFRRCSTAFARPEQDTIASQYGVEQRPVFATWLRSLNHLRNVCAHHSRLWNRNIVEPKLPSSAELAWVTPFETDAHARARCFLLLKITRHLLGMVNPRSSWPDRMKAHLLAFPISLT